MPDSALAADHVIGDEPAFHEACRLAAAAAEKGAIVTFGIEPTGPRTSYGYIRRGAPLGTGAWKVDAFVEKPDAETAERYLSEGYLWNSGNFLFPASLLAAEVERFQPTIASAVRESVEGRQVDHDFIRLEKAAFARTPALSIDYAVMEHTHAAAVVEGRFPWSDVGSWKALKEIGEATEDGNVIRGPAKLIDSRNSYIHSEGPLVTALGLDDIAVIATEDAVLVMPSARSEDVKALVAALKAEQRSEAAEHIKNYRPWGTYQTALLGSRFRVKKIVVDPGARLSLQKHHHRAEHWIVVHGTAEVTVGERVFELHENQSTYIPLGELHRLANPGRIPLELIEVQTGVLSRRGRHRPPRGHLQPLLSAGRKKTRGRPCRRRVTPHIARHGRCRPRRLRERHACDRTETDGCTPIGPIGRSPDERSRGNTRPPEEETAYDDGLLFGRTALPPLISCIDLPAAWT